MTGKAGILSALPELTEEIQWYAEVKEVEDAAGRITFGGPQCDRPYHGSRLNISAMSFGSLSANAIRAMNRGAALGGFAHNTGEGGLSPYHLEYGADVIWELGTAYFGCRTKKGRFDASEFACAHPDELTPALIYHRPEYGPARAYADLYPSLQPGQLQGNDIPPDFVEDWRAASADRF